MATRGRKRLSGAQRKKFAKDRKKFFETNAAWAKHDKMMGFVPGPVPTSPHKRRPKRSVGHLITIRRGNGESKKRRWIRKRSGK